MVAGQPLIDRYVPDWLAAEEELLALKASAQPGVAPLVDAARQRLRLPDNVSAGEIRAATKDGVLTVVLPKAPKAEARRKEIPVA